MSTLPETDRQRIADEAAMWCDLLLADRQAESARFDVTRRAELYTRVAGLPLAKVLDALGVDEDGWGRRLAELRAWQRENRAAHTDPTEGGGKA